MATVAEIRAQIEAARQERDEALRQQAQAAREHEDAIDRQKLRREFDWIREETDTARSYTRVNRGWREDIDADRSGPHLEGRRSHSTYTQPTDRLGPKCGEIMDYKQAVSTGEFFWKLKGMSWLVNTLKQRVEEYAVSDTFNVGGEDFCLKYHPEGGLVGAEHQRGSLAIVHEGEAGVTFRYRISIKRAGGDFAQWGETGDECHPHHTPFQSLEGQAFGPDVQVEGQDGRLAQPIGVFGLSHTELLCSEWIEDDTLAVKVLVEVRQDVDPESIEQAVELNVEISPPTIGTDLLALLKEGTCGDVTFTVEGESINAHSQILCARSDVFRSQLNIGMRESVSKEIVIEDCDINTFKAMLQFLYTDDLACMQAMVNAGCSRHECASDDSDQIADASDGNNSAKPNERMSLLQNVLALSHRYQLSRLKQWCEQQLLSDRLAADDVCSVLRAAHLYEARVLEKTCLEFIKVNMAAVVVTPAFGRLGVEWPQVMLKVNLCLSGVSESSAAAATDALLDARRGGANKRKRDE